jgi:hypothetical protein
MPVRKLRKMLGQKSAVTTQHYLADVELSGEEATRMGMTASFVPAPPVAQAVD